MFAIASKKVNNNKFDLIINGNIQIMCLTGVFITSSHYTYKPIIINLKKNILNYQWSRNMRDEM